MDKLNVSDLVDEIQNSKEDLSTATPETYKGIELENNWENDPFKLGMYAFYDKKSNKYDTPFFCQSHTFAKRHYTMVTEQESMISRFKEDFDMIHLGIINLQKGSFNENNEVIVFGTPNIKKEKK